MKLFEMDAQYVLYVDLDGVLSNLDKFVMQLTGVKFEELRGPLFTKLLSDYREQGQTFFDQLEKMPDADLLWQFVSKHKPNILTATGPERVKATAEKIEWVYTHLHDFDKVYSVASGSQKYQYAKPNHILIDDTPKNIQLWKNAGGIGILHRDASSTIQKLKALGLY
jgi:phosphoglycolate phosphatase-like HAD superfamily hydrolase